jgi:putative Mg2+ transporter-C (MgtC) family protein
MPVLDDLVATVVGEFAELSPVTAAQLAVRLIVAGLLGGLLGWTRERVGKSAGIRTHVLVCLGSCAFVAIPLQGGLGEEGVSRVLQGLVAGIGFLGAGCIMKPDRGEHVTGLTTAAGIWLTAAVGASAGLGREMSAIILALVGWFTLAVLVQWEARIRRQSAEPTSLPSQK